MIGLQKLKRNIKIIVLALSIALWYNASSRLFEALIPNRDMGTTLILFLVAGVILTYNDACIAEVLFDFRNSAFFKEKE